MRNITISPVLNGFVVTVGCQQLAYTSVDKLTLDLAAYLRDPGATQKRFLKEEAINRKYTLGLPDEMQENPRDHHGVVVCGNLSTAATATGLSPIGNTLCGVLAYNEAPSPKPNAQG